MIKLERAVFHAYKCIGAGESFEVGEEITALMGKNEVGKTSVLEALAKANYYNGNDEKFRYSEVYDYPRRRRRELEGAGKSPAAVTCTYTVDADLAKRIEQDMLLPVKGSSFSRTTDYSGKSRVTENSFTYPVESFLLAYAGRKEPQIEKYIRPLLRVRNGREFRDFISGTGEGMTREEKQALEKLAPYFENRLGWENPVNEYVYRIYLLPAIPRFLYYDEYMMLPSRVSVNRLAENSKLNDSEQMAKALLLLAGIDLRKLILEREPERCKSELEMAQAELTEEFLKYWKSDGNLGIEFELVCEEEKKEAKSGGLFSRMWKKHDKAQQDIFLEIRVRDRKNMVSMPLESRSRGFCWFFSFWVWFKAIQKEHACPFVLLLDEPGLNLHASTQRDLMCLMRDISRQDQIIFTSHSPYMLEDLEDVFCITGKEGGSAIRTLEEETDGETLMPVQWRKKEDIPEQK